MIYNCEHFCEIMNILRKLFIENKKVTASPGPIIETPVYAHAFYF